MPSLTPTELLLIALLVIFSVPWLIWRLARTDYYAPLVAIQILTGIALGPGVLGAFIPEVHAALFSPHLRRVSGAGLAGGWLGV